jgi:hypothetical protein
MHEAQKTMMLYFADLRIYLLKEDSDAVPMYMDRGGAE